MANTHVDVVASNEAVDSVEILLQSLADLRNVTRETEAIVRKALKGAKAGADVLTTLQACNPGDTRLAMNQALKNVESARHAMRLHIFKLGLEQGLSIGEMGRHFGISRQLAARYAREATA